MKLFKMDELEIPGNETELDGDSEFDMPLSDLLDSGEDDTDLDTPLIDLINSDSELNFNDELDSGEDFEMSDDLDTPLIDLIGGPSLSDEEDSDVSLFGDESAEGDELLDGEQSEEEIDPDYQGIIRTVKGAYLVYKRKQPDDTFEELWIYNVGKDLKQETQTRRAVLAGTDIDPTTNQSEDGDQSVESTTLGNVQYLLIQNLEN